MPDDPTNKTLIHELGHIRAEHETRFLDRYHDSIACRGWAEVEAESVAYVVAASAGMPTGDYSVPYVANCSDGDASLLRDTAARVVDVARRITADLGLDSAEGIGPPAVERGVSRTMATPKIDAPDLSFQGREL